MKVSLVLTIFIILNFILELSIPFFPIFYLRVNGISPDTYFLNFYQKFTFQQNQ